MERCDVDLRFDDRKEFEEKCKSPAFVSDCLKKYQRCRRGIGEYEWSGDPVTEPPMPFCAASLSMIWDAATGFIDELVRIKNGN